MRSSTPGSCTLVFNCGELSKVSVAPGVLMKLAGGTGVLLHLIPA